MVRVSALAALAGEERWVTSILDLLNAIDGYLPVPERYLDAPFLMAVENCMTITGRGTVVTGAIERGQVRVGDLVELIGLGAAARSVVTIVETFGKTMAAAQAGDNAALLLRGVGRHQVRRGQVLAAPGSVGAHQRFAATVQLLSAAEGGRRTPVRPGYRPQFYLRTTDVAGELDFGDPAGGAAVASAGPGQTVALGAAAQINPVWLFGPYEPGSISSGSVPDWYMGFLDGALRIMPAWEPTLGGHPLSLDVLIPAVIVPGLFFTVIAAYPLLDGRIASGRPARGLLPPKPGDAANRTAFGVAGITLYGLLWAAAGNDEIAYHLQVSLYTVTWVFRVLVLAGPVLAFALTRMSCHAAQARRRDEAAHGFETGRIVMTPEGGFTEIREPVTAAGTMVRSAE